MQKPEEYIVLFHQIQRARAHLSDSSINTYISTLHNFYKKLTNTLAYPTREFFIKNMDAVLDYLSNHDMSLNRRKLILASIVVLINDSELSRPYSNAMIQDVKQHQLDIQSQQKTERQQTNWLTQAEIKQRYDEINKNIRPILRIPNEKLSKSDIRKLNDWMIISLYTLIPPRRLHDYVYMLNPQYPEPYDIKTENYIDKKKGTLVFNRYKTARTYGAQVVPMTPQLKKNMNEYLKKILGLDTRYLLFHELKNIPFTSSTLNKRLYSIFNKKVSVNILRHSYISENVLRDMPRLSELQNIAEQMGHNVSQQILYKKI